MDSIKIDEIRASRVTLEKCNVGDIYCEDVKLVDCKVRMLHCTGECTKDEITQIENVIRRWHNGIYCFTVCNIPKPK